MNAIDTFERTLERTLEEWGHNLRGGAPAHGLQPRDVLSEILKSLEENRVEGLDHKIYAPNAYRVILSLDEEERSRLLPFLGHEELEAAVVERYCRQRKYEFRGPLSLVVTDTGLSNSAPIFGAAADQPTDNSATVPSGRKTLVQSSFDVPADYNSELASQFVLPERVEQIESEHAKERRDAPSYSGAGHEG